MTKRTGFLQLEEIPLNKVGLSIRAYGKKKNYVGRVEINHAGLAAFTGPKGKKCIANLSWEKLFATLSNHVRKTPARWLALSTITRRRKPRCSPACSVTVTSYQNLKLEQRWSPQWAASYQAKAKQPFERLRLDKILGISPKTVKTHRHKHPLEDELSYDSRRWCGTRSEMASLKPR
jgi:hypothetical protein